MEKSHWIWKLRRKRKKRDEWSKKIKAKVTFVRNIGEMRLKMFQNQSSFQSIDHGFCPITLTLYQNHIKHYHKKLLWIYLGSFGIIEEPKKIHSIFRDKIQGIFCILSKIIKKLSQANLADITFLPLETISALLHILS